MGCVCCSLSTFVSIVLQALERISLCTVCCLLVCCLLFTIVSVMVLGIGIGFHYCMVQNNVDAMKKAAQAVGALRSGAERPEQKTPFLRSLDKAVKRGFAHRVHRERRSDRGGNMTQYDNFGNYTHFNDTSTYLTNLTSSIAKFNTTL